ncbi:MAG: hypothetical protein KJ882_01005 [Proteobacteria bacterium]|nr:hypothetical protein [Pseudomonadota bacterium]
MTSEQEKPRVTAFGIYMPFNNYVKHPNRHAGLDKPAPAGCKPGVSRTQ